MFEWGGKHQNHDSNLSNQKEKLLMEIKNISYKKEIINPLLEYNYQLSNFLVSIRNFLNL